MLPIEKLKRKPMVPFNSERKQKYLELFRSHPELRGCRALCAEAVGISLTALYDHLKKDLEFAEAYEDALQAFIDEAMFAPALRRAAQGVEEPVLGGKFRDEVVATKRVYSDSLMIAMLRAHRSEFRDKDAAATSGGTAGGVLIIPGAPTNVSDWEKNFGELAKGNLGATTKVEK